MYLKLIVCIVTLQILGEVNAQSITYYRGKSWAESKIVQSVIGSTGEIIFRDFSQIALAYPVTNSLEVIGSYWAHRTLTEFHIYQPNMSSLGRSVFGHGTSRIKQRRYGLGLQYTFLDIYNVISLHGIAKVEYEKSFGGRSLSNSRVVRSLAPDEVVDFFPAVASVTTEHGSQFVPSIGFGGKYKLPWRLSLSVQYLWSYGHRRTQTLFLDYSFQGEEQPRGEWFSDGTMHIMAIGLSVQIWGDKNKVTDKISWIGR